MPCEEATRRMLEYYREKGFEDDELEFLMEDWQGWTKEYKNAAYIKMPFYDKPQLQQFTRDAAEYFQWKFNLVDGDMSLLEKFIAGDWDPKDFLVVPPGCEVVPSYDDNVITWRKL